MHRKDTSLDELSSAIRFELTRNTSQRLSVDMTYKVGSRVKVIESFESINEPPEAISAGIYGRILVCDDSDNSLEIKFSGYFTSQWVHEADTSRLQIDDAVQIAPTENFLSAEFIRWSFVQSSAMCCGLMPHRVESCLFKTSQGHCFSKSGDVPCVSTSRNLTPDQSSESEMSTATSGRGRKGCEHANTQGTTDAPQRASQWSIPGILEIDDIMVIPDSSSGDSSFGNVLYAKNDDDDDEDDDDLEQISIRPACNLFSDAGAATCTDKGLENMMAVLRNNSDFHGESPEAQRRRTMAVQRYNSQSGKSETDLQN